VCDSFLGVCSPSNRKQQSTKVFLPHTQCKPEENCAANLQTGVTQHKMWNSKIKMRKLNDET
jgi:hypothetical protein